MKTNTNTSFSPTRGIAPIIIILAIVVIGGGVYAVVNRAVLKEFFQTGDKPTQEQFADTIDSSVHKQDDSSTDKKVVTPMKEYPSGDTAVHSGLIYQAKVLGEVQPVFKLDSAQAVTFRWTPLVPKPQEPVTYRLKVWQLMQGQNSTEAMRTNKPIVTKDVDNVTETTVSGIYTGPCKPPYLCDFVWSAEAVTAASAAGTATGASAATDASASTGTSGY